VRNGEGDLPLHVACYKLAQDADLIALLINKWPQAVRDACPRTEALPLHLACKAQNPPASLATLKLLVEAWPDAMCVQDEDGFLPLHYACPKVKMVTSDIEDLQLEKIKLLVERKPECLQIPAYYGMLPLHWACFHPMSSTNIICYLVGLYTAAVFVCDMKGRLPLHLACTQRTRNPPLEVIQCLVRAWPESIHIPQGDDQQSDYNSEDDSEDTDNENESSDKGLQALALDLVCLSVTLKKQPAQVIPELLLLLTTGMPPLHFACVHAWIPTRLKTV